MCVCLSGWCLCVRVLHRSAISCLLLRIKSPIDTETLQTDKCVLTTLKEISTWSPGSLQGTRSYLHLLPLAEQMLNLLRDLWLLHWNPSLGSVLLFHLHPHFSFCSLTFLLPHFVYWLSLLSRLSSALVLRSMSHCERQECLDVCSYVADCTVCRKVKLGIGRVTTSPPRANNSPVITSNVFYCQLFTD